MPSLGGETVGRAKSSKTPRPELNQQPELGPMPKAAALLNIDPHQYRLWIRTFGRLRVYVDYRELTSRDWSYPKVQSLLRFLLLQHQSIPLDAVLEPIWPNLPSNRARQNFSVALHHLRSALEPHRTKHHDSDLIIYKNRQVRFNHAHVLVDRNLFIQLNREKSMTNPAHERYRALNEAMVSLYAGQLFEDEPYQDWCLRERERLEEMYLMTREELARLSLEEGDPVTALRHCENILDRDPLREVAHIIVMKAYMALGHRTRAVNHYHQLAQLLADELGMMPATTIQQLYEEILEC